MFRRYLPAVLLVFGAYAATAQTNPSFELYQISAQNQQVFNNGGIASGDFNNDGKPDMVQYGGLVNQSGNGVIFFPGNGDGTFGNPVLSGGGNQGSNVSGLVVADFNRDGNLDIAVVNISGGFQVFYGNGNGTFQQPLTFATTTPGISISVGDFNGDGLQDIVIGENNNSVEVFQNVGGRNFVPVFHKQVDTVQPIYFTQVAAADFDRNGTWDIAVMTLSNAYVLWGNGKNGFTQTLLKSYPNGTGVLGVGDLNQDSAPDILVSYSTCVPQQNPRSTTTCAGIDAFYGGQGPQKTYYRNLVNNPNFQQPYSNIFAVDINGDGIGDIATLDGSGAQSALYVWLGHPDGSFDQNPWQFTATTDGGNGPMAMGDFNRDGKMDFAIALVGTATTETLLNATNIASCATSAISPTVTVCQPVDWTYQTSPVRVQATTHDTNGVTALQEYIDNSLVFNQNVSSMNQTFALGNGWHYLVTKAWDSAGRSFRSDRHVYVYSGTPGATCAAAPGSAQICLPSGAHSSSPVHIVANGYPTPPIIATAAQLYIDGNLVVNNAGTDTYVDTYQNLSNGTHQLVFKNWDANGNAYTATKTVTVP